MEIFVPFSERLVEQTGVVGRLVPFQLEYPCARLHGWESVEVFSDDVDPHAAPAAETAEKLQAH